MPKQLRKFTDAAEPRRKIGIGVLLIAFATWLVYAPSLRGGFIFDDELLLAKNDVLRSPDALRRIWFSTEPFEYYPLSYSTMWLEWRLWRANPFGYHVTNLVLYVAGCLLLWAVLRKLAVPGAFLAALLFAVHPVNVESVAWISQLRNVLALVFFLLSILWYWRARERRVSALRQSEEGRGFWIWWAASLLAFLLAMLSKGSVACLPVVLIGAVWWKNNRLARTDWLAILPFVLIALALTALNIWFQTHGAAHSIRTATFEQRLAGAGAIVWFYLAKAFLPIHLLFFYNQWQIDAGRLRWWLPLAFAIAVVTVLAATQKRNPWSRSLLLAAGFFCVALLPVLGFADTGYMRYSLVADHYQLLALIGVVTLVAAFWDQLYRRARGIYKTISVAAAALVIGLLALQTTNQNRLYADPVALYEASLRYNSDSWLVRCNLGAALAGAARISEAIEQYDEALRLDPQAPDAHLQMGSLLRQLGKLPEAIEQFQIGLRLDPSSFSANNDLANALQQAGQIEQAMQCYTQALRLKPNSAEAHNNLGTLLAKKGNFSEAIQQYQQALALRPDFSESRFNLANSLLKTGRPLEAIDQFQEVLRLAPTDLEAATNLMNACAQAGHTQEAVAAGDAALKLARSQGNLALVQQLENWLAAARSALEKKCALILLTG